MTVASRTEIRSFVDRETPYTLATEAAFARRIEAMRGWRLQKLGGSYSPDYAIYKRNLCKGWLEVKCRYGQNWNQYPTYMIGVKKWEKCMALANTPGIQMPFLLAVCVDDGDFIMNCSAAIAKGMAVVVKPGGRVDRDWVEDLEPCVYIPKQHFARLHHDRL